MNKPKAAVLGGAFDPFTKGHLAAADLLAQMGYLALIMPCGDHHAFGKQMAPAEDRLLIARLACAHHPRVRVIDYDIHHGDGQTFTLWERMKHDNWGRNYDLHWVIGTDNANTIATWYRGAELPYLLKFITINRPGHPLKESGFWAKAEPHTLLPSPTEVEVSSSLARKALKEGDAGKIEEYLPAESLSYIRKHHLYGV